MTPASPVELQVHLSEDANKVTLSMHRDGNMLSFAQVEAPELSATIELLAAARAKMIDTVPMEMEPAGRFLEMVDPVWRTKIPTNLPAPSVALAIRHPGYGWIVSHLPVHEAKAMGQSLLDLSGQVTAASTDKPA